MTHDLPKGTLQAGGMSIGGAALPYDPTTTLAAKLGEALTRAELADFPHDATNGDWPTLMDRVTMEELLQRRRAACSFISEMRQIPMPHDIRGHHADRLIMDDPIRDDEPRGPAEVFTMPKIPTFNPADHPDLHTWPRHSSWDPAAGPDKAVQITMAVRPSDGCMFILSVDTLDFTTARKRRRWPKINRPTKPGHRRPRWRQIERRRRMAGYTPCMWCGLSCDLGADGRHPLFGICSDCHRRGDRGRADG